MKKALFNAVMEIKSRHSVTLQALGFSKDFARNTPVHKILTALAYSLCK